jgi:hypothetical protein
METFSNPFVMILFVLTMIVISLSVISFRIQKSNKIQRKTFEQSQIKSDDQFTSIGVYFQGGRTLGKCLECAELISLEAKICKHCGSNVENHVSQLMEKVIELRKKQDKAEAIKKETDLRYFKDVGLLLIAVVVVVSAFSFLTPIVKDQFFPSKIQNLAKEWEVVLSECGFQDVKVIIGYKSDELFDNYPAALEAEGKFKSTPETKECLTEKLDNVYAKFNTQGNRWPSKWSIGNTNSGDWNNDYADAWEIYTLEHVWMVP